MPNEITTTDFSNFGWRERRMAANLLMASCEQGFPEEFEDDEVQIMFNTHSGNVFFTNAQCQTCLMNGDDLEMWWYTPYHGHEGFAEELAAQVDTTWNAEDIRYLLENDIITQERHDELLGVNTDDEEDDDEEDENA